MLIEAELKHILKSNKIIGEETKLVVSKDGLHLSSVGLKENDRDTFSAMCATMFGAGETALFKIGKNLTQYLALVSQSATLYITDAGERALIGVVVGASTPLKDVIAPMKKMANEIEMLDLF